MWFSAVPLFYALLVVGKIKAKLDTDEEEDESGNQDLDSGDHLQNITNNAAAIINSAQELDESSEHIGASVTQIYRHPYTAAILKNNTYVCSAVILNTYWIITVSKCFDANIVSSYVSTRHKNLHNYSVRVGSSYNNKGGSIHKIRTLINNFDMRVSATKLESPLVFSSNVHSVRLPSMDDDVNLGRLAAMIAWTPTGHIRVVNAPVIEPSICEPYTRLIPGHYVCLGGVQDPNRHFCRRDDGGAVIQNNTLIAVSSFIHTCALYTKTHGFPKISSFARWLDSVIWDEDNRPTTTTQTTTVTTTTARVNITQTPLSVNNPYFADPRKFMLTLPFAPVNVPLEPSGDNSVIPRLSLYESYLQNLARAKTSTTQDPSVYEEQKREWLAKVSKAVMMMPPPAYAAQKYDNYEYN